MSRPSKMQESVGPHTALILEGHLLAIDPSSGSRDSQPGYAIFKAGVLIDSGHISVQANWEPARRLRYLGTCLRDQFECPDVLVCENIPPFIADKSGKGNFFNKSMMSLQRAIGLVIGSFDAPLIEVAPISWRKNIPDNYKKTDEADAIMMAVTVIRSAQGMKGLPLMPIKGRLKEKLETDVWTAQPEVGA